MYVTGTIINDEERIHAKDVYHRLGIDRPKTVKNLVAGAMRELGWDHVNSMRIGNGHPGLAIYVKSKSSSQSKTRRDVSNRRAVSKGRESNISNTHQTRSVSSKG
jgi:hypothetical protein